VEVRPVAGLRRSADIVFPRQRLAVFVDGCFWHGCPEHCRRPTRNAEWWAAKIDGNRSRDADTNERLAAAGWQVMRVWEHEDPELVADAIVASISEWNARSSSR
jgi:DNA mismatch endonuclease (patch repair protein)